MKKLIITTFIALALFETTLLGSDLKVLSFDDVKWEPLNPLRGDKSPQAAPLWGGLNSNVSTAFLVKFRDGFSSPPHIHNVTYRGVVISGLVHNDDPDAAHLWMPTGSFWTQPAGEVHITAAKGESNIAYIEIDHGPYLVKPASEAFDNGERPVNIDQRNLVWLDAKDIIWVDQGGVRVSFLWGERAEGQFNGTMIMLPKGFDGQIHSDGKLFKAVIIQGQVAHLSEDLDRATKLIPGSYFGAEGKAIHPISSDLQQETLIYVRTNGKMKIISNANT
ncbi:MAG: DUF4437 domain-containing protein [Bacteroidota bacterium]